MSLRFALLALLRVGPQSGYDLQKQFSLSVGHVWHAADSQIYPELRRMAGEDLIEAEEQTRGERGTRRVYHVTPDGEQAFFDWLNETPTYQRVRDPAHLRASYLESATPDAARSFMHAHAAHWEGELGRWEAELAMINTSSNPMLMRRLSITRDEDRIRTIAYKRFSYEGLIDRAKTEIAWAKRGLKLIDSLEG